MSGFGNRATRSISTLTLGHCRDRRYPVIHVSGGTVRVSVVTRSGLEPETLDLELV